MSTPEAAVRGSGRGMGLSSVHGWSLTGGVVVLRALKTCVLMPSAVVPPNRYSPVELATAEAPLTATGRCRSTVLLLPSASFQPVRLPLSMVPT